MMDQEQGITRERVKGFMDEDLHAQIDAMPEAAFNYLTAILVEIFTLENE